MKLLSLAILLSSIIFTFNYVWINRIDIKSVDKNFTLLINKWTGHHCYITPELEYQEDIQEQGIIACIFSKQGKIEFP